MRGTQQTAMICTGEKQFKRPIYNATFISNSGLHFHNTTTHEERKPLKCEICGNDFIHKQNLTQNVTTVYEGKKFDYDLCDDISIQNVKRHITTVHKGKKLFKYDLCHISKEV